MFNRHFLKMFFALIGMILLGMIGLFVINAYEKAKYGEGGSSSGRVYQPY